MITVDLSQVEGRRYPARRRTKNIVGGASPIQAKNFCIGNVVLDPRGGQVPWHNQEQEEVYILLEGEAEMCLGAERRVLTAGQAVYIPPGAVQWIENTGATPLIFLCIVDPAWRAEDEEVLE